MKNSRNLAATLFAWNDLLWTLLACFMLLTALLVTQIQKMKTDVKAEDDKSAGSISVYVFWKDGIDLDIDTHLSDPRGDHVYFSKPSGRVWNLLRDDMGMAGDSAGRNFENAYARGLPPGNYQSNIHAYRGTPSLYPIEVEAEVRVIADPTEGKAAKQVIRQRVTLYRTGEEITLVRFSIDAEGNVVTGSINHIFKPLVKEGG